MNITPLRDLILVVLEDVPPEQRGLIEIVRTHREPSCYARVLAVGPEARETRVGARVVVSRLQGIEIDGSVLLPEGAVLATLPEPEPASDPGACRHPELGCAGSCRAEIACND